MIDLAYSSRWRRFDFEKNYAAKKTTDSKRKGSAPASSAADKKKCGEREKPSGFGRGLDPERIIRATDSSGELMFLIKWKGSDEADLVPSREANVKCPQAIDVIFLSLFLLFFMLCGHARCL